MTGRIIGVGVGPGDPELVTVLAARLVGEADVVAFHSARHGKSIAYSAIKPYLRGDQLEEALVYPLTTDSTDHPGGYAGAMEDFYVTASAKLAEHVEAGRFVVVACEGDPSFYGSYMHLHERLKDRYDASIVPGIPSISAAAAAAGVPLVMHEQGLHVLPGTVPAEELVARIGGADAVAILKLGRTFPRVREALELAGVADRAIYIERAGTQGQRIEALLDVDPDTVPYMSLALVPGAVRPFLETPAMGEVAVIGLGSGNPSQLTAEAARALADATDIVGYTPYVDRVPKRRGQRRHGSDNRVEAERAEMALDMAAKGLRVAVVSSGDPGVFAMATAVLEASEGRDVSVRIIPGVTAAQTVAARVGAPLGHDFCILSLSTQLKPWDIVAQRLEAVAAADLVIGLYNPASMTRRDAITQAKAILLRHRSPETPVVLARDVDGDEESISVVTLAQLDVDAVDMRTLVLVGSTQSRSWMGPAGRPIVMTPRRYPS